MEIRRGDVLMLNLPPSNGSKQSGRRPAVVVQNDTGNHFAPTTIVIPGTSANKRNNLPTHVRFGANPRRGIDLDTTFMAEQVQVIDKSEILEKLGRLTDSELAEVSVALQVSMGLMPRSARNVS